MATAEYSGDASSRASKTTPQQTEVTLTSVRVEETLALCPSSIRIKAAYAVFSGGRFAGYVRSGSPGVARAVPLRGQSWQAITLAGEALPHRAGTAERAAWLLSDCPCPNLAS